MGQLFGRFNFRQTVMLTISLMGVLLVSNFGSLPAAAQPVKMVTVTRVQTSPLIAKGSTLEPPQVSLEKKFTSVKKAPENRLGLLAEPIVSMNPADLARKRNVLVRAQKQLEESAKAYEKRAAQLEQELLTLIYKGTK